MFTGLIEDVGRVVDVQATASGSRLRLRTPIAAEMTAGESVAVNGVCLTVAALAAGEIQADIGPETARVTTLGSLRPDQPVNMERAMRADSRFGGHFVQGHVDGTGTIEELRPDGDAHWIAIRFPPELAPYLIRKGSVAVDGISLTVVDLSADRFTVMIVPFTWTHTNLPDLRAGARVNLECDMVGKYVARAVDLFRPA